MKKIVMSGFCSLSLFATGAEGAENWEGNYIPVLHVPQLKDGADHKNKMVTIEGAVKKRGAISWMKDLTLAGALAEAGGLSNLANLKKVTVTRNGKRYLFNLKNVNAKDLVILPGDHIKVAENWF